MEEGRDGVRPLAEVLRPVEDVVAIAELLREAVTPFEARAVDSDFFRRRRRGGVGDHPLNRRGGEKLRFETRFEVGPRIAEEAQPAFEFVRFDEFLAAFALDRLAETGRSEIFFEFAFDRFPSSEVLRNRGDRGVEGRFAPSRQNPFVKRGGGDGADADFEPVRRRFAVISVMLIVPKVAELVFGAGRGAGRFRLLHRQPAHNETFGEARQRFFIAASDAGRVGDRVAEGILNERPSDFVDRFRSDQVGENPVRARRNFRDQVGVSCGIHLERRFANDVHIEQNPARRRTGERLFAFVVFDRGAERRVPVHRGGGADDGVGAPDEIRGAFAKIVDRSGTDGDRNRVGRRKASVQSIDPTRFGVHLRRVENERVFDGDSGGFEAFENGASGDIERRYVRDDDRFCVGAEEVFEERTGAFERSFAENDRFRVVAILERFIDSRRRLAIKFVDFRHKNLDGR